MGLMSIILEGVNILHYKQNILMHFGNGS